MPKKKITAAATDASAATPDTDAPVLPPAAATVLSLLDAQEAATAADMAERSGLGRSTVTKALSTLHEAGLAVRQEGGHEGIRRIADRWFAAPATTAPGTDADVEAQAADHGDAHAAVAEPVKANDEDSAADPVSTTASPEAEKTDGGSATHEPKADQWDTTVTETEADGEPDVAKSADVERDEDAIDVGPDEEAQHNDGENSAPTAADGEPETKPDSHDRIADPAESPAEVAGHDGSEGANADQGGADEPIEETGHTSDGADAADRDTQEATASEPRLGKGELRVQVEAYLRENPEKSFTSTELHHVLNRSSGAIANACETLVKQEKAIVANERKPRRFQWNPVAEFDAS